MKRFVFGLVLALSLSAHANDWRIDDPMLLLPRARLVVAQDFPDAQLWLAQTYARSAWDKGCSQFGWSFLFIGSQDGLRKSIQAKFDHQLINGSCEYTLRGLEIESDQTMGLQRPALEKVLVSFVDADQTAHIVAKVPFRVWFAKLVTPLHPFAAGRVFWNFIGPLKCDKRAEITIDATTGKFEPFFSTIPECPQEQPLP